MCVINDVYKLKKSKNQNQMQEEVVCWAKWKIAATVVLSLSKLFPGICFVVDSAGS